MRGAFSPAWALLALPFFSCAVIARASRLRALAPTPVAQAIGLAGLSAFCAGFIGLLPPAGAAMAVVCGGAVAGFCFWTLNAEGGSDDDGGLARDRPPDEHPPSPEPGDGPIEWQEFDRLRAEWERSPALKR